MKLWKLSFLPLSVLANDGSDPTMLDCSKVAPKGKTLVVELAESYLRGHEGEIVGHGSALTLKNKSGQPEAINSYSVIFQRNRDGTNGTFTIGLDESGYNAFMTLSLEANGQIEAKVIRDNDTFELIKGTTGICQKREFDPGQ